MFIEMKYGNEKRLNETTNFRHYLKANFNLKLCTTL